MRRPYPPALVVRRKQPESRQGPGTKEGISLSSIRSEPSIDEPSNMSLPSEVPYSRPALRHLDILVDPRDVGEGFGAGESPPGTRWNLQLPAPTALETRSKWRGKSDAGWGRDRGHREEKQGGRNCTSTELRATRADGPTAPLQSSESSVLSTRHSAGAVEKIFHSSIRLNSLNPARAMSRSGPFPDQSSPHCDGGSRWTNRGRPAFIASLPSFSRVSRYYAPADAWLQARSPRCRAAGASGRTLAG